LYYVFSPIQAGGLVKYSSVLFILLSALMTSPGFGQSFRIHHNPNFVASPLSPDSIVIHYDGENDGNSIGDGESAFTGGAHFRDTIMNKYTGDTIKYVQFFYAQGATGLTIKIYNSGTDTTAGTEIISQPLILDSLSLADWNTIELNPYLPVTGNDIWVCLQVEDTTFSNYPFGVDAGPADPDGDWVNDSGIWEHLSDYGFNYNWNIRAVVESAVTSVAVNEKGPLTFNLYQNYPNPFNPTTKINFDISEPGNAKLVVYNTIGQQVAVLVNGFVTAGSHEVNFNASSLPSGVYLYKLQSGNSVMIKKMLLLK
jgi:hypothetical protein